VLPTSTWIKRARLLTPGTLFFCSGWLLAIALACYILPRAAHWLYLSFPSVQREDWQRTFAQKRQELSVPWKDSRPLIIIAGDSQIEMGDWYQLLGGSYAVRNCGLSRAKISDVTDLISAIADRNPKEVVLMCGINNLGSHDSVESCGKDYEQLLLKTRSMLNPNKIIVLSVMPVRESAVDRKSHDVNGQVVNFNHELESICKRDQARFVDLGATMSDNCGGLAPMLTTDGLHPNFQGYRKIAAVLTNVLSEAN
jgi:lysophospholipase L1-like esterase